MSGKDQVKSDQSRFKTLTRRRVFELAGTAMLAMTLNPFGWKSQAATKKSRVVMVRDPKATSYSFGSGESYAGTIDQAVVDKMADDGLKLLTGAASVKEAWQEIIPDFEPGHVVAIKVNFNNTHPNFGEPWDRDPYMMNALPETLNAIIRGLLQLGFSESDIWIYDSVRAISKYFSDNLRYGGVSLWDNSDESGRRRSNFDTGVSVTYSDSTIVPTPLCNVVTDADWLINVPILKAHHGAGVTLGFKNHFGTISGCSRLHSRVWPEQGLRFSEDYNPMVDICLNPHIRNKTVLTVGDALFGNPITEGGAPYRWNKLFDGGSPDSLLFSTDMVAIESVMRDLILLERGSEIEGCAAFLPLAEKAGLGVYEHGDPMKFDGYEKIEFLWPDLYGSPDDMEMLSVKMKPKKPATGKAARLIAKTKNSGKKAVYPTTVNFYLSKNRKLNKKDILLGSSDVPALDAGGTATAKLKTTLPDSMKPGKYYVIAKLIQSDDKKCQVRSDKKIAIS